jgi:hypothetical protein
LLGKRVVRGAARKRANHQSCKHKND